MFSFLERLHRDRNFRPKRSDPQRIRSQSAQSAFTTCYYVPDDVAGAGVTPMEYRQ